jgi:hypothetical protein
MARHGDTDLHLVWLCTSFERTSKRATDITTSLAQATSQKATYRYIDSLLEECQLPLLYEGRLRGFVSEHELADVLDVLPKSSVDSAGANLGGGRVVGLMACHTATPFEGSRSLLSIQHRFTGIFKSHLVLKATHHAFKCVCSPIRSD